MDHLGHALDTKAVSLVQGLWPYCTGVQLLLVIQASRFYSVLSTSHQDYVAVVHAARSVIERKLILRGLTAVPVLVISSAPTAVPMPESKEVPTATPPAAPMAS